MSDFAGQAIRDYHERTKHSPASVRASPHLLDWEIQPLPFKIYEDLDRIPLPSQRAESDVPAIEAIASSGVARSGNVVPDRKGLARLMHFSAGITRRKVYPSGQAMFFRAAACTGALYHIDLYLVCGALPDLDAGVYHFGSHDLALRRLRAGDYRALVVEATAGEPAVRTAPAILISTSTFWRNAWKYQARTYRHCFWDDGTMLANLLAMAAADRVPVRLVMGFVDGTINQLLALDTDREVALSLITVGDQAASPPPAPPLADLSPETVPLSSREVDYPEIRTAHMASSLDSANEVRSWRGSPPARRLPSPTGNTFPLRPLPAPTGATVERAILRRGSTRHFAHSTISFEQLSTLLKYAAPFDSDFLFDPVSGSGRTTDDASEQTLTDLYLIVNAVDDLPSGAYVYHRRLEMLELLREGDFRRAAGFLDLGQSLAADASVNFYFLADLEPVLKRFGDRGYRAAQLEAAITGGKLYLGAYALGLGATGLTFFDDEVTDFFSPHAAGKSVMFLVAVGEGYRPRPKAV